MNYYLKKEIEVKHLFTGSDALISEQPYRYLTADLMKSLRDDSLPIDVTRDDPIHRQGKITKITYTSILRLRTHDFPNLLNGFRLVTKEEKQEFTQSNNYCLAENFETDGFNLGYVKFLSYENRIAQSSNAI